MSLLRIMRKIAVCAGGLSAVSFCALVVIILANPGHASAAYSTDLNCTDASTEFNVVVVARVLDYQGNLKGYANNYSFHVNAFETNLAYKDYGPWSTWHNLKASGHDDYDSKRDTVNGGADNTVWRWRDFPAAWTYYDSRNVDYSFGDHPKFSNEATDWITYRSEAIRRWNNGYYTHDGKNHDFNVTMDSNYVNGSLSGSGMALGKGNACQIGGSMQPTYAFRDGDNTHHVTLPTANSYGAAAAWTNQQWVGTQALGHDGNNESWSLSCLGQSDSGSININWMYFNFAITNQATWDRSYVVNAQSWTSRQTAAAGGTWSGPQDLRAVNGSSVTIYFDYKEPTPPTPPTMTSQANLNNTDPAADAANYIEPGGSFTASGQVNASASTYGGSATATWRVWYDTDQDFLTNTPTTNPPLIANVTRTLTFAAAGGSQLIGSMGPTTIPLPYGDIYSYICSQVEIVGVSGSPTPLGLGSKSTKCIPIERRPFFQAVGGDVNASAVFPDPVNGNCATTVPVGKGLIAGWNRGSTGSYNGAGTNIAAFAAQAIADFASYRPGAPPKGLTFASTGTYGGSFDEVYCMDKITSYDAGDVFVTPNSGLDTYNGNITTTGNIKISHNVTTINGVFITKGKIYTCADDSGNPATSGTMKSLCSSTLTVNGAFVADIIYLLRINGSLSSNIPAEVFNYGPNTWLPSIAAPSGGGAGSINLGDADSETSLPPVL